MCIVRCAEEQSPEMRSDAPISMFQNCTAGKPGRDLSDVTVCTASLNSCLSPLCCVHQFVRTDEGGGGEAGRNGSPVENTVAETQNNVFIAVVPQEPPTAAVLSLPCQLQRGMKKLLLGLGEAVVITALLCDTHIAA